jgi:hypothetical protein
MMTNNKENDPNFFLQDPNVMRRVAIQLIQRKAGFQGQNLAESERAHSPGHTGKCRLHDDDISPFDGKTGPNERVSM